MQPVKSAKKHPKGSDCAEVLLFSNVKDEINRLPYFLNYYRELGVNQFYIVDNNSSDGTFEFLSKQEDVTLFHEERSFLHKMDWMDEVRDKYGLNHWCLTADADELLVYPNCEQLALPEFCQYLEENDYQALFCLMIDFYPAGPVMQFHGINSLLKGALPALLTLT